MEINIWIKEYLPLKIQFCIRGGRIILEIPEAACRPFWRRFNNSPLSSLVRSILYLVLVLYQYFSFTVAVRSAS